MKIKFFIYSLGLLSGIIICLFFNHLKNLKHNHAISEYLEYYDQHEFMKTTADQINLSQIQLLDLTDLKNEQTNIQFNNEKVVFINLWASWSQPCLDQLGSIENLKTQFENQIDFYIISAEPIERLKKIQTAIRTNLPFYSYSDENLLPDYLKRGVIPYTIIIYKGSVWFEHIGTAPWDSDKIINLINSIIS